MDRIEKHLIIKKDRQVGTGKPWNADFGCCAQILVQPPHHWLDLLQPLTVKDTRREQHGVSSPVAFTGPVSSLPPAQMRHRPPLC